MVEYSSVSASSYDPASLVAKLNASAEEGWDVVSIVPTGGDVTAFLRRDGGPVDEAPPEVEASAATDADVIALETEAATETVEPDVAVADATPAGTPAPRGGERPPIRRAPPRATGCRPSLPPTWSPHRSRRSRSPRT